MRKILIFFVISLLGIWSCSTDGDDGESIPDTRPDFDINFSDCVILNEISPNLELITRTRSRFADPLGLRFGGLPQFEDSGIVDAGTDLETIFPFYQISFLRGNEVSVRINQGFIEGNYNESDDSWEVIVDILIPGDGEDVPFQFTQIFRRSR